VFLCVSNYSKGKRVASVLQLATDPKDVPLNTFFNAVNAGICIGIVEGVFDMLEGNDCNNYSCIDAPDGINTRQLIARGR
jgi:hypothetical protein